MFIGMENLKLVGTYSGICGLHKRVTDQPSHALIFKQQGESRYIFHDKSLLLYSGSMLFIPQNESYTVEALSTGRYYLIGFTANFPYARPHIFSPSNQVKLNSLCYRLENYQISDSPENQLGFYALFYELLAFLSAEEKENYYQTNTLSYLDPAIEYLHENLFNPELKVGMLHTLCGISDTYFRRLFFSRFGIPPKKYVLMHRLNFAHNKLLSGEYNSIAEVAHISGFDDPLYFSKLYHSAFSESPSLVFQQAKRKISFEKDSAF